MLISHNNDNLRSQTVKYQGHEIPKDEPILKLQRWLHIVYTIRTIHLVIYSLDIHDNLACFIVDITVIVKVNISDFVEE